jgi:hypothetical protein
LIPGLLGFLTGAIIYGATYQSVFPAISALLNFGATIFPTALDVNLWLTVLFFVLMALTMFYFLERHGELRKDKVNP